MKAPAVNNETNTKWLHLGIIVVAVIFAWFRVFQAGFLSWDDGEYILNNSDIRAISGTTIAAWFSNFYVGNYHPLTLFSYAIDYLLGGNQPLSYHITSILLHCVNGCLVYLLIRKLQQSAMIALFTALIFSLHPAQAESVSWIAERKTVLSGTFSLAAFLLYIRYLTVPTTKQLFWVFAASACAMLSKGTAVVIPLSLLAFDIWTQQETGKARIWQRKIPLFLLALSIGLVAIKAQSSGNFLDSHSSITIVYRFIYAGYAYTQYIVHFLLPTGISAMYPYPETIGPVQYIYTAIAIGILMLGVLAHKRKWHVLCGGILFYTVNVAFMLQLFPFGEALMADRYMYFACLGLIYPVAYYLFNWLAGISKKIAIPTITTLVAAALLSLTFIRNIDWMNDANFFQAMLRTFPNSAVAQYSVGGMYMKSGHYAEAEIHLSKAVRLDPNNYKAWHNKGALHLRQGKAMEALEALNKSIAINGYPKAYFTRALLHLSSGKSELAIADLDKVLVAEPRNARAWHLKGSCYEQMGDESKALENYNKAIDFDATEPVFYIRRGMIFSKMKKHKLAISDLAIAVSLSPGNADAVYYLGMAKYEARQSPCNDLQKAARLGSPKANEAIARLCGKY